MSERRDVCYWHKADIGLRSVYVADIGPLRSAPFPGQVLAATMCCLSLGGHETARVHHASWPRPLHARRKKKSVALRQAIARPGRRGLECIKHKAHTHIGRAKVIRDARQRGTRPCSTALKAELERLRQENAALKKGAAAGVSMKKHLFAAAQLVLDSPCCCDLNE